MVSPIPWASITEIPAAPFMIPAVPAPASVMPMCMGYGYFCDRRKFALTVSITELDLAEMIISSKEQFLRIFTCSSTAKASAADLSPFVCSSCALLMEPPFAPMRITAPKLWASFITSSVPFLSLIFPGLMRIDGQPASNAAIASLWLKWISAMIGTGDIELSNFILSAKARSGSDTLTSSHPSFARAAHSKAHSSKLESGVFIMLSTRTGELPPIVRPLISTLFLLPIFIARQFI